MAQSWRLTGLTGNSIGVLAAWAALSTPAFAQAPQEPQQSGGIGEIVVTAQFREQRLQDTPLAITAIDSEMLEARSQTNLTDIAAQAPNVQLQQQGVSFGPSVIASIRGIGQNDFNPAYEPGVGIYIDDVYYPQLTGAVFDLLDLDRVEVLRGPQGTLAGRNSIGGAIKMFSRNPTGEGGYVAGTYGSEERIDVRASADFTLAPNLFARLSGVSKQQGGYVDRIDFGCAHPAGADPLNPLPGIPRVLPASDCKFGELGEIGYQAIRGILRYAPNDDLEIKLIGDFIHDRRTIAGEVLLAVEPVDNPNTNPAPGIIYDERFICGRYCNYATTGNPAAAWVPGVLGIGAGTQLLATSGTDEQRYDSWGTSAQIRYNFTDSVSIDSISAYRRFNTTFDTDDDLSPAFTNFGHNDLDNWNLSQELRLNVDIGDTIDLTLGGYYFDQRSIYFSYQDIRYVSIPGLGPLFPLQFTQPDVIEADAKAAFAHVSWEVIDALTLSGGVRYTEESKDYHYFRLNPDGTINGFLDPVGAVSGAGAPGALTGSVNHYEGDRVDWRGAIDYRFSDAVLAYASVSTGFKGGGTNPRPFNVGQVISFDPETLTNYEIGLKTDLFDRRARFNISTFYDDYKDIQIPVLSCPDTPCAARLNAGDGRFWGIEAELLVQPVDAFQMDASVSYLNFEYESLNPEASIPTNPAGASLSDPSASPEWKWSLGAQYEVDLAEGWGSLTPRIDAAYQDDLFTGPVTVNGVRSLTFIPSYTLTNARLTWRNEERDVDVALEVTNLFDEYYLLSNFDLRGAGTGFDKGLPGRPQEWAITVRKDF